MRVTGRAVEAVVAVETVELATWVAVAMAAAS